MAVISVRASGDLPVISDYLPLISVYFFLSLSYTFISFVWFATSNYFKTSCSIPQILKTLAKHIIKIKKFILKSFKKNVVNTTDQEIESDYLISVLNNLAFFTMSSTMFISYLCIWLLISN